MIEVEIGWEDDGTCLVHSITCKCGHCAQLGNTFNSGDIWECPKCRSKIRFVWRGMGWKEVNEEKTKTK